MSPGRPKNYIKKATVLYDYVSSEKDDLQLKQGTTVEILETFDSWYLGRQGNHHDLSINKYIPVLSEASILEKKSSKGSSRIGRLFSLKKDKSHNESKKAPSAVTTDVPSSSPSRDLPKPAPSSSLPRPPPPPSQAPQTSPDSSHPLPPLPERMKESPLPQLPAVPISPASTRPLPIPETPVDTGHSDTPNSTLPKIPSAELPKVPKTANDTLVDATQNSTPLPEIPPNPMSPIPALPALPDLPAIPVLSPKQSELPGQKDDKPSEQESASVPQEKHKEILRGPPKSAIVLTDYESDLPEELYLAAGDTVDIIHQGTNNDSRWKGNYHGRIGYFPGEIVKPIIESGEELPNNDDSYSTPKDLPDNPPVKEEIKGSADVANGDSHSLIDNKDEVFEDSSSDLNREEPVAEVAPVDDTKQADTGSSKNSQPIPPPIAPQRSGVGSLLLDKNVLSELRKTQRHVTKNQASADVPTDTSVASTPPIGIRSLKTVPRNSRNPDSKHSSPAAGSNVSD
ncbi:hypothetical protein AYI70_g10807, partial [Smittium culicis]